ncbi:MAG: transposase [Thermoproteota archaeon]
MVSGLYPKFFFSIYDHDITGAEVILFLDILSKRIPRMMLWDNASIHRSLEVEELLYMNADRIETHRFSAYAPELNPDECIISHLKSKEFANFCPRDEGKMKLGLKKAIARMMRKTELIKRLMLCSLLFIGKY